MLITLDFRLVFFSFFPLPSCALFFFFVGLLCFVLTPIDASLRALFMQKLTMFICFFFLFRFFIYLRQCTLVSLCVCVAMLLNNIRRLFALVFVSVICGGHLFLSFFSYSIITMFNWMVLVLSLSFFFFSVFFLHPSFFLFSYATFLTTFFFFSVLKSFALPLNTVRCFLRYYPCLIRSDREKREYLRFPLKREVDA